MGKDFSKEIRFLKDTYTEAINADVSSISNFINESKNNNLLCVGSGGSFSSAYFFSYFNQRVGKLSKAITPLELHDYARTLRETSVALLTSSGRNNDVLNSYKYLAGFETKRILTICMKKDTPIEKLQKHDRHNTFYDFSTPIKSDGFLAVNSLFATIVILSKAFYEVSNMPFFSLPKLFNCENKVIDYQTSELNSVLQKKTIILLHGGISTPIAVDMESKFNEAALGNIHPSDFRNFAHGRHYWLSQYPDDTSIIALIGIREKNIAEKTLGMLPNTVPIYKVYFRDDNIESMLSVFYYMLRIVEFAGKIKKVNPGRPKIEDYGRNLYHINYNLKADYNGLEKSTIVRAIYRKIGTCAPCEESINIVKSEIKKINSITFKGIIFDYDGTLVDKKNLKISSEIFTIINEALDMGISIGVSTGRGKSVRHELQKKIDRVHWNKVLIGYYNGQVVGNLDEESLPNNNIPIFDELNNIYKELDILSRDEYSMDLRPYQLTIMSSNGIIESNDMFLIREICNQYKNVKIVKSSHSLDIVHIDSNKKSLLSYMYKLNNDINDDNVLFVGDSGQLGGNDYELLISSTGLSVDEVSTSLNGCWNFSPFSTRGIESTLYYLKSIEFSKGTFSIKIK